MNDNTVSILLVEDDQVDAEAVIRAFRHVRIANPIVQARDGVEALAILRGEGSREPLSRPFLILLDLNMPRMNGIEFLEAIRSDVQLSNSIVFVLTTSNTERDIAAAYQHQVAGYMVKSKAGEDFVQLTGMLNHYWRIVEFPPEYDSFDA